MIYRVNKRRYQILILDLNDSLLFMIIFINIRVNQVLKN